MQLYYDLTAVHVMFDMLDKPNIAGDVYNITLENDLASAVQLYNDAMSSGNLQLSVVVGTDVKVRMTMMMICFIKHKIVSLETTLSAYSRARARTHTHEHVGYSPSALQFAELLTIFELLYNVSLACLT